MTAAAAGEAPLNPLHPQRIRRKLAELGLPWDVLNFLTQISVEGGMQGVWRVTNATLAKRYGRSERTITRWAREGRDLGFLSRYSMADGRAWVFRLHPRNILKAAGELIDRVAEELRPVLEEKPLKQKLERVAPVESRQRRRRRERFAGVASPRLAWLWNTAPNRVLGAATVDPQDDCWPAELLELPEGDQAAVIDIYHQLCKCGGRRAHPCAPSIRRFQRHWAELPAFIANPEMPQPRLGRELRPFPLPALDPMRCGPLADRYLAAAPMRVPAVDDVELRFIPRLLQAAWLDDVWDRLWWYLVDQTGPPPDELPRELRPRWGSLDLF